MQSFKQEGRVLPLIAPYNRLGGQGAKVGAIFGVAMSDVTSGDEGEFMVEGVHSLAKASGAVSQGDRLYWDDSAKNLTKTATAGMLVGVATADALSGDANVTCRLNESVSEYSEGPQAAIAALTDNSGGATADGTIGAVTLPNLSAWNGSVDPTAAQATAINDALTALTDAVKELSTKQNAVIAALHAAGITG